MEEPQPPRTEGKPPDPRPPRKRNPNGTFVGKKPKVVTAKDRAGRNGDGTFAVGFPGAPGQDAGRARKLLNADTIREFHAAFRAGGREAIEKVMRYQPAVFLKLLVLLVPRELEVTTYRGVKGLSDEQLEQSIEAIKRMLEARANAGENARVIEGEEIKPESKADEPSANST